MFYYNQANSKSISGLISFIIYMQIIFILDAKKNIQKWDLIVKSQF